MSKIKDYLDTLHATDVYLPTRTVFLTGDITEKLYDSTIKNLHALDTEPETVTVYINSEGGEVDSGFGIYNSVKGMKSFMELYLSDDMVGSDGSLGDAGLIPLPKNELDEVRKNVLN